MITLTELLPKEIKSIESGSELLLAYALDVQLQKLMGERLEVNVPINKEILKTQMFSIVRDLEEFSSNNNEGVNYKSSLLTEEQYKAPHVDYSKRQKELFNEDVSEVEFVEVTDEKVVYSFYHNTQKNIVLHKDNRAQAYVMMLARLVVIAYKEGKQQPKLVIDHKNYSATAREYNHLLVLVEHGNEIFKGIVDIQYMEEKEYQPLWSAFIEYSTQRGRMVKETTPKQKLKYINKHYQVGDVMLRYKRSGLQGGREGVLDNCFISVIREINEHRISLDYYPSATTLQTRIIELSYVEEEMDTDNGKSIFTEEDYETFIVCRENHSLLSVGVESTTYSEEIVLLEPMRGDNTRQHYNVGGRLKTVEMDTFDTIYAVLEDRGVEYNKERFLDKYFASRGVTPKHDELVNVDYTDR